jgi:hypothetical protein
MNHLCVRIISVIAALLMSCTACAQVPQWKLGFFKELDNSYIETALGIDKSIDEARNKAATEIIRRRDAATGASAKIVNGQVTVSGELVVKTRLLDEYIEKHSNGVYYVYILTQTAKHPDNVFETVTVTNEYPFSARSFVPGMQQLYKGQIFKGLTLITAEVASIGGIFLCENSRAKYSNKASVETNAKRKKIYIDNANTMQTTRNIFISAVAAVYVWNVIDAIVTKGAKYIDLQDIALSPYASTEGFGLSLSYHF